MQSRMSGSPDPRLRTQCTEVNHAGAVYKVLYSFATTTPPAKCINQNLGRLVCRGSVDELCSHKEPSGVILCNQPSTSCHVTLAESLTVQTIHFQLVSTFPCHTSNTASDIQVQGTASSRGLRVLERARRLELFATSH